MDRQPVLNIGLLPGLQVRSAWRRAPTATADTCKPCSPSDEGGRKRLPMHGVEADPRVSLPLPHHPDRPVFWSVRHNGGREWAPFDPSNRFTPRLRRPICPLLFESLRFAPPRTETQNRPQRQQGSKRRGYSHRHSKIYVRRLGQPLPSRPPCEVIGFAITKTLCRVLSNLLTERFYNRQP